MLPTIATLLALLPVFVYERAADDADASCSPADHHHHHSLPPRRFVDHRTFCPCSCPSPEGDCRRLADLWSLLPGVKEKGISLRKKKIDFGRNFQNLPDDRFVSLASLANSSVFAEQAEPGSRERSCSDEHCCLDRRFCCSSSPGTGLFEHCLTLDDISP